MFDVLVKVDSDNNIIDISSSFFIKNVSTDWVKIDSGIGIRYMHAQGNYMSGPIHNIFGVPLYKLVDGKIVKRDGTEVENSYIPIDTAISRIEKLEKSLSVIKELLAKLGMK